MIETFNKERVLEDVREMQECLLAMHQVMKMIYDKLTTIRKEVEQDETN